MLSEENRQKLDAIVMQMEEANESESDIQLVINDFKSKYDEQETPKDYIAEFNAINPDEEAQAQFAKINELANKGNADAKRFIEESSATGYTRPQQGELDLGGYLGKFQEQQHSQMFDETALKLSQNLNIDLENAKSVLGSNPRAMQLIAENGLPDTIKGWANLGMMLGLDELSGLGRTATSAYQQAENLVTGEGNLGFDQFRKDQARTQGFENQGIQSELMSPTLPISMAMGGPLTSLGGKVVSRMLPTTTTKAIGEGIGGSLMGGFEQLGQAGTAFAENSALGGEGLKRESEMPTMKETALMMLTGGALGSAMPYAKKGFDSFVKPMFKADPNTSTGALARDLIETSQKTGVAMEDLSKIPNYARGVMTKLDDTDRQVFKDFQNQARLYHNRESGAVRPLEAEADKWLPVIKTKFNDYRKKIGSEMGSIEEKGFKGEADPSDILLTLENTLKEDGLELTLNPNTNKFEILETTTSKINPDDFPELGVVVNEFFNKLPTKPTLEELRSTQQKAMNSAKKLTQLGQANKADRILGIVNEKINDELQKKLNQISPKLGERYAMLKTKYGEVKDIQEFLGDRTGKDLKWTKEDTGDVSSGMQTGASFLQALTNSGSNQRGATYLLNLAEKEFGVPNLSKRAIMARYAEEASGIRGARDIKEPTNPILKTFDWVGKKVSKNYEANKLIPTQSKIAEQLANPK